MPIEGGRKKGDPRAATFVTIGCLVLVVVGIALVAYFFQFAMANNL